MPWSSKARIMAARADGQQQVAEFHFPAVVLPAGAVGSLQAQNGGDGADAGVELLFSEPVDAGSAARRLTETDAEDRARQEFEAGRQEGIAEALAQARLELEKALAAERAKLVSALEEFNREKDAYFRSVEPQIVRLALAIARKVLHREVQLDALALTGIVRVTLEKLAAGCHAKLRVPSAQTARWQSAVLPEDFPNLQLEIVPDDLLEGPQCRLETDTATTDLSIDAQLDEIERGFLDLLESRASKLPHSQGNAEAPALP